MGGTERAWIAGDFHQTRGAFSHGQVSCCIESQIIIHTLKFGWIIHHEPTKTKKDNADSCEAHCPLRHELPPVLGIHPEKKHVSRMPEYRRQG